MGGISRPLLLSLHEVVDPHTGLVPTWRTIATALTGGLEFLVKTAKRDAATVRTDSLELAETLIEARYQTAPEAEPHLYDLAKHRSAETGETFEQAYVKVVMENPALYAQYQQERADAARGTQFAQSLAFPGTRQHGVTQRKKANKA